MEVVWSNDNTQDLGNVRWSAYITPITPGVNTTFAVNGARNMISPALVGAGLVVASGQFLGNDLQQNLVSNIGYALSVQRVATASEDTLATVARFFGVILRRERGYVNPM